MGLFHSAPPSHARPVGDLRRPFKNHSLNPERVLVRSNGIPTSKSKSTPTAGNPETEVQSVGMQFALETIQERQFKQPETYLNFRLSDGELDLLLSTLRDHDRSANYPVRWYLGKCNGDDWLLSFGDVNRRAEGTSGPVHGRVTITTDHVHASEMRGDALDDAQCYVALRNNLPCVLASLEELLRYRLGQR